MLIFLGFIDNIVIKKTRNKNKKKNATIDILNNKKNKFLIIKNFFIL